MATAEQRKASQQRNAQRNAKANAKQQSQISNSKQNISQNRGHSSKQTGNQVERGFVPNTNAVAEAKAGRKISVQLFESLSLSDKAKVSVARNVHLQEQIKINDHQNSGVKKRAQIERAKQESKKASGLVSNAIKKEQNKIKSNKIAEAHARVNSIQANIKALSKTPNAINHTKIEHRTSAKNQYNKQLARIPGEQAKLKQAKDDLAKLNNLDPSTLSNSNISSLRKESNVQSQIDKKNKTNEVKANFGNKKKGPNVFKTGARTNPQKQNTQQRTKAVERQEIVGSNIFTGNQNGVGQANNNPNLPLSVLGGNSFPLSAQPPKQKFLYESKHKKSIIEKNSQGQITSITSFTKSKGQNISVGLSENLSLNAKVNQDNSIPAILKGTKDYSKPVKDIKDAGYNSIFNLGTILGSIPESISRDVKAGFKKDEHGRFPSNAHFEDEISPKLKTTLVDSLIEGKPTGRSTIFNVASGVTDVGLFLAPIPAIKGAKGIKNIKTGNKNKKIAQNLGNEIFETNVDKALGIKLSKDPNKTKKLSNAIRKSNRETPVGVEKINANSFLISAGTESKPGPSILANFGKGKKSTVFTQIKTDELLTPSNLLVKGKTGNEFTNTIKLTDNILGVKGTPDNLRKLGDPSIRNFLQPEAKLTDIETSLLTKYPKSTVGAIDSGKGKFNSNLFATTERRNHIKGFNQDIGKLPNPGSKVRNTKSNIMDILNGNKKGNKHTGFKDITKPGKSNQVTTPTKNNFKNNVRNLVKAESKSKTQNPIITIASSNVGASLLGSRLSTGNKAQISSGIKQDTRVNQVTNSILDIKQDNKHTFKPFTAQVITPVQTHVIPPITTTTQITTFPPFNPTITEFPPPTRITTVPRIPGLPLSFFKGGGGRRFLGQKKTTGFNKYTTTAISSDINIKRLPGDFLKTSRSKNVFSKLTKLDKKEKSKTRNTFMFGGKIDVKKGKKGKGKKNNLPSVFGNTAKALGL
jgi:hypothetical protein